MEYWSGRMNWPLVANWSCETCGAEVDCLRGLTWGFVHATCRCDICHTEYRMRDPEGNIVSTPIVNLRSEFKQAAKAAWEKYRISVDDLTPEQWQECGVPQEAFAD